MGGNGYDDWLLDLTPNGGDARVFAFAIEYSRDRGSVELFSRHEDSTDANGWLSHGAVATAGRGYIQTASLTFMALNAFDYVLRIGGHAGHIGAIYKFGVAAVSPVPLPAAAWLFASALAGGFFISRKKRKSS